MLTPAHVSLANPKSKNRGKKSRSREGYVDENGQIFLPPKSPKRLSVWKQKMGL